MVDGVRAAGGRVVTALVIGLDLSSTRSGVADHFGRLHSVQPKIKPKKGDTNGQARRLNQMVDGIDHLICTSIGHRCTAVIEDYATAGHQGETMARIAEVGGVIRLRLFERGIDIVTVRPTIVKKWATNKGNATKDEMVAAAVAAGVCPANDDEADAFWLRHIGLALSYDLDALAATGDPGWDLYRVSVLTHLKETN